jgi:hypothetical protein
MDIINNLPPSIREAYEQRQAIPEEYKREFLEKLGLEAPAVEELTKKSKRKEEQP